MIKLERLDCYNGKRNMPYMYGDHNSIDNWASDCCGMRLDNAINPTVNPTDSYIGVRIYLNGHVQDAGEHNEVVNLITKNGPIGVVLTQKVITTHRHGLNDPGLIEDDGWDEDDEDEE